MTAPADLQIVPYDPDNHDVLKFDCDDADLNDFLRTDAIPYQHHHISWTRVAVSQGNVCGYLTLLADSIILKTPEKKSWLPFHTKVMTFPAVKIGRLAIQKDCQKSGIGTALLKHAIGVVVLLNSDLKVGCRFITVDAYPQSVSWYGQKGFAFNKHYRDMTKTHPSMRYDILLSPKVE